jgi:hypothetical protein
MKSLITTDIGKRSELKREENRQRTEADQKSRSLERAQLARKSKTPKQQLTTGLGTQTGGSGPQVTMTTATRSAHGSRQLWV